MSFPFSGFEIGYYALFLMLKKYFYLVLGILFVFGSELRNGTFISSWILSVAQWLGRN